MKCLNYFAIIYIILHFVQIFSLLNGLISSCSIIKKMFYCKIKRYSTVSFISNNFIKNAMSKI